MTILKVFCLNIELYSLRNSLFLNVFEINMYSKIDVIYILRYITIQYILVKRVDDLVRLQNGDEKLPHERNLANKIFALHVRSSYNSLSIAA